MKFGYGNVIYGLCKEPVLLYRGRARFKMPNSQIIYYLPIYREVPTVKGDYGRIAVQQDDGSYAMYEYMNGLLYTGYTKITSGLQMDDSVESFINNLISGVDNMTIKANIVSIKEDGLSSKDNG